MTNETLDLTLKAVIALATVVAALLGVLNNRAIKANTSAVQKVEVNLDGRLSQLLEQTAHASRAEGRDSMRAGDGLDAGSIGPAGPAGIQGPVGPQGQVGPAGVQGATGEHSL
jgi:outer membrane murein-binding lipoprotein Lpp